MKRKLICIGGGMGPMAGVELHRLIIANTPTNGLDQEHIEVHHFSRAHDISDRPLFLLEGIGENPAHGMLRTILAAKSAASAVNLEMIIGIPCITFHANPIFDKLLELLKQHKIKDTVLNMITITVNAIGKDYSNIRKVGLLTTTATQKIGVLRNALEAKGLKVIELSDKRQKDVQNSISDPDWGIKSNFPVSEKADQNFHQFANELIALGAEAIVLGCTEIPLALTENEINSIPLINPSLILAKALIKKAAKQFP